uniref:Uncharacterized protein n=1 Tax=Knipowitschia caucasica TaxID=637954 RepID=A0AAV2MBV9_KNICA
MTGRDPVSNMWLRLQSVQLQRLVLSTGVSLPRRFPLTDTHLIKHVPPGQSGATVNVMDWLSAQQVPPVPLLFRILLLVLMSVWQLTADA